MLLCYSLIYLIRFGLMIYSSNDKHKTLNSFLDDGFTSLHYINIINCPINGAAIVQLLEFD